MHRMPDVLRFLLFVFFDETDYALFELLSETFIVFFLENEAQVLLVMFDHEGEDGLATVRSGLEELLRNHHLMHMITL